MHAGTLVVWDVRCRLRRSPVWMAGESTTGRTWRPVAKRSRTELFNARLAPAGRSLVRDAETLPALHRRTHPRGSARVIDPCFLHPASQPFGRAAACRATLAVRRRVTRWGRAGSELHRATGSALALAAVGHAALGLPPVRRGFRRAIPTGFQTLRVTPCSPRGSQPTGSHDVAAQREPTVASLPVPPI